jgi:hypothetical protein
MMFGLFTGPMPMPAKGAESLADFLKAASVVDDVWLARAAAEPQRNRERHAEWVFKRMHHGETADKE